MLDREAAGREASPTAGVLDSQTVKAPFAEVRGFDGARRVVGRTPRSLLGSNGASRAHCRSLSQNSPDIPRPRADNKGESRPALPRKPVYGARP